MENSEIDQQVVKNQYQSSNNLEARIRLHSLFSTNSYGWYPWLMDHLDLQLGMRVLELGCGPASLWQSQSHRLPEDICIILTDVSPGMVGKAQQNISDPRFRFAITDAQSIAFPAASMDAVIANHMLYHVPDRDRAIAGIRRVLKPGGKFYAATNGIHHQEEILRLSAVLQGQAEEPGLNASQRWSSSFTLENGGEQISAYFPQVQIERYADELNITQAQPLVDYLLSMFDTFQTQVSEETIRQFTHEREEEIRTNGSIRVRKDTGVWIAS